jgi:PHD/YefM family antitoxin component YafN of YafNO toxin-antitoxin module
MEMVRMTEAELQQGFRALADRARREPVTITTPYGTTPDGRDELVVLSAEEYARLKRRDRRVGLTRQRAPGGARGRERKIVPALSWRRYARPTRRRRGRGAA